MTALELTADEVKKLRCRLGWSQAEFARQMKTELATIAAWELGTAPVDKIYLNQLTFIMNQAEMNAERVQRRPVAEIIMKDRGLSQIHDFDVLDSFHLNVTSKSSL